MRNQFGKKEAFTGYIAEKNAHAKQIHLQIT